MPLVMIALLCGVPIGVVLVIVLKKTQPLERSIFIGSVSSLLTFLCLAPLFSLIFFVGPKTWEVQQSNFNLHAPNWSEVYFWQNLRGDVQEISAIGFILALVFSLLSIFLSRAKMRYLAFFALFVWLSFAIYAVATYD